MSSLWPPLKRTRGCGAESGRRARLHCSAFFFAMRPPQIRRQKCSLTRAKCAALKSCRQRQPWVDAGARTASTKPEAGTKGAQKALRMPSTLPAPGSFARSSARIGPSLPHDARLTIRARRRLHACLVANERRGLQQLPLERTSNCRLRVEDNVQARPQRSRMICASSSGPARRNYRCAEAFVSGWRGKIFCEVITENELSATAVPPR